MNSTAAPEFINEGIYLDTAAIGLPPRATRAALAADLADWSAGRARVDAYLDNVEVGRAAYASLVHAPIGTVSVGHQTSPLVGLVAASVPEGTEVLVPVGEFTSLTYPFAAHESRGVRIREVPLEQVAEAIGPNTSWVAVSAVQSADGRIADVAAIVAAARRHHTRVLLDVTQSAGWLDLSASAVDVTVCSGYKWLLAPRGTALMTISPGVLDDLRPLWANWYACPREDAAFYGLPLRPSTDARRFDASPAWNAWAGATAALEYLLDIGAPALQEHALSVAETFAAAADLPPTGSAIRALEVLDQDAVDAVTGSLGVVSSSRAGRMRVSFHINNTEEEAAQVGAALRGLVR